MKFRTNQQTNQVVPITSPVDNKEYLHTTSAGVVVPFWQTVITGFLVFAGAFLMGWLVFDLVDPLKPAIVLTIVITIGVWLWRLKEWATLAKMEKLTGLDLNKDGVVGTPDVMRLKWSNVNDGKNGPSYEAKEADFPINREQLVTLAEGLLTGRPFSQREWCGQGKPFSINEWKSIGSVMYRRGLIERVSEKDSRQGWLLSEEGWNVMEHISAEYGSGVTAEDAE